MTLMRTTAAWTLTCVAALCLTACSGTPDTADAPSTAGSATSSASSPAPPATTPTADASDGAATVSAAALCDYLTSQLPDLRAIGSTVGAMANLTMNLYGWYDQQGAVPSGSEIDTQTQEQCPDVGSEVLTLAGVDTFASL